MDSRQLQSQFVLDAQHIIKYSQLVSDVIDTRWIQRELSKEHILNTSNEKAIKSRKHSYLSKPAPHPLISWLLEFNGWVESLRIDRNLKFNESVVKLALLGRNLEEARNQIGFEKLLDRLKKKDSFFSAYFEAEVATSYLNGGCGVEFIEESFNKTPDLKVSLPNGIILFAECKCRDAISVRDQKINSFWAKVEQGLLAFLGPKKINVAVHVFSSVDPTSSDADSLLSAIINEVNKNLLVSNSLGSSNLKFEILNKYRVSVTLLTHPDAIIYGDTLSVQSKSRVDNQFITCEMLKTTDGISTIINPIILGYTNSMPSDKVSGIIGAFKSAVKQLPEEGPGVIWIRIPDSNWSDNLDENFERARELLQSKVSGDHNRRVNAVVLLTHAIQMIHDEDGYIPAYTPVALTITHKNPRYLLEPTSHNN